MDVSKELMKVAHNLIRAEKILAAKMPERTQQHASALSSTIRNIAQLELQQANIVHSAAMESKKLAGESAQLQDQVTKYLRKYRKKNLAAQAVYELMKMNEMDTSELSSRLIDEVENQGFKAYPPSWSHGRREYYIVGR